MKKPILITILLLVCVNVGVFIGYFISRKTERVVTNVPPDRQAACGPLCLRIAANLYGLPSDEAHALSLCPPGTDGTQLRDIQRAAPKFGMKATIVNLTWDKLLTMTEFAILHVNDDHYVLANPNEQNNERGGNAIRIYDYDLGARWYDQKSLEAIYGGEHHLSLQKTLVLSFRRSFQLLPTGLIKGIIRTSTTLIILSSLKMCRRILSN